MEEEYLLAGNKDKIHLSGYRIPNKPEDLYSNIKEKITVNLKS